MIPLLERADRRGFIECRPDGVQPADQGVLARRRDLEVHACGTSREDELSGEINGEAVALRVGGQGGKDAQLLGVELTRSSPLLAALSAKMPAKVVPMMARMPSWSRPQTACSREEPQP